MKKIKWIDAESRSQWMSKKEIAEWVKKLKPCTSVGTITYEDRKFIVVSGSFDGEENYGENIIIPKSLIKK